MGCFIKVIGIFICFNLLRVCNFLVVVDDGRDYFGFCNYMDCKWFLKRNWNFVNGMIIVRIRFGMENVFIIYVVSIYGIFIVLIMCW